MKYISAADEVWHAGDIGSETICSDIEKIRPLKAVYGNIDGNALRVSYPEFNFFECEGVKVLITHIAGSFGKYTADLKKKIKELKPALLVCGHSHICKVAYDKEFELLYMNPGACGVHGFHKVKTALQFELVNNEVKNLSVIELGPRSSIK